MPFAASTANGDREDCQGILLEVGHTPSAQPNDFQKWIRSILPIAYEVERLSPDLANDGPNPEYPWPHDQPRTAPVTHEFAVWQSLKSGSGRYLLRFVHTAIKRFPDYADT
jgi:hypothetical protein